MPLNRLIMEYRPKISVIIPVHNEGEHLSLCLDSLLNNLEKEIEIIVVDDGSTDNSLTIAQRYANAHNCIHVFRQQQTGVCGARNFGLQQAVGQFITFVDGDAYVDEHLLDHYLQLQMQGDFDLVACGVAHSNHSKRRQMELDQEGMLHNLFDDLFYHDNTFVWNKMYRTQIIRRSNVQFEAKYGYNADRMFNFQFMRHASKALFNDQSYYHCVVQKGSIRKRDLNRHEYGALAGFERMLYYSRKYSIRLQEAIAKHYCQYAMSVYRSDSEMRQQMLQIIKDNIEKTHGFTRYKCRLFLMNPGLISKVTL